MTDERDLEAERWFDMLNDERPIAGDAFTEMLNEIHRLRARLVKYQDCDTMINDELKDVRAKLADAEDEIHAFIGSGIGTGY